MLTRITLFDPLLAEMLDGLSRADVEGHRRSINYRDLTVQQLGTICERLLERDVVPDGVAVRVTANDTARHHTGSYFTTEKLVQLIIAQAVGPFA